MATRIIVYICKELNFTGAPRGVYRCNYLERRDELLLSLSGRAQGRKAFRAISDLAAASLPSGLSCEQLGAGIATKSLNFILFEP